MEITRPRIRRPEGKTSSTTSHQSTNDNGNAGKTNFNSMDEVLGLLENMPLNVMYCGTDLVIKYVNPKSIETLGALEKYLPVRIDQVVGSSVDVFHKDPSHQQKILSNPKRLPVNSIIEVGPEKLSLLVSPVYDANQEYVGAMVTWDIVTEKLESEKRLARMNSMMENAPINVMMADRDHNIMYINPKSMETLRSLQKHLPVPVDKILGGSIDVFHKNPAHQRKMLEDDRNLPHQAKIKVGEETLSLLVTPTYDHNRNYLGPMVVWDIITDKLNLINTLEETSNNLGASAEELSATATQMSKNSKNTSEQSTSAAAAAEEVSQGVKTVATNTEEMVASIKEISKSSSEAAEISKDAAQQATSTNQTIAELGEQSQEIGNVIKVISSIAQQTNLLALNATIEAARAGDAGKGFAVVANEVKELAKQTAKATEDITNRISAIQESSKNAVTAIGSIAKVIDKVNNISMAIAASVEEQTATTNEVARVVQEANTGVENISETVKVVAGAAEQSSAGAGQTLEAAKGLNELAVKLNELVKAIKV